jgi:hypothetical protein
LIWRGWRRCVSRREEERMCAEVSVPRQPWSRPAAERAGKLAPNATRPGWSCAPTPAAARAARGSEREALGLGAGDSPSGRPSAPEGVQAPGPTARRRTGAEGGTGVAAPPVAAVRCEPCTSSSRAPIHLAGPASAASSPPGKASGATLAVAASPWARSLPSSGTASSTTHGGWAGAASASTAATAATFFLPPAFGML